MRRKNKDQNNTEFLTEESLGNFLKTYLPEGNWISQYRLPNTRFRIDWFSDNFKICVEFDGYQHYTSSRQILADMKKDDLCLDLNLKIIRIPYFVQLSNDVIQNLFGMKLPNYRQSFPHGFVSNKSTMMFPADFCQLGIERFEKDLKKFSYIKTDILKSLKEKNLDKRLLLPKSLFRLID